MFACTFVEKIASIDHYDSGCEIQSRCILADPVNIVADDIPSLLVAIGERYGLTIDDVWIPEQDEPIELIGYNRLETDDGDEPTDRERDAWKRGESTLYLADYHFTIESRETSPVPVAAFAGVKTH